MINWKNCIRLNWHLILMIPSLCCAGILAKNKGCHVNILHTEWDSVCNNRSIIVCDSKLELDHA
jgi:hypothetical protein